MSRQWAGPLPGGPWLQGVPWTTVNSRETTTGSSAGDEAWERSVEGLGALEAGGLGGE